MVAPPGIYLLLLDTTYLDISGHLITKSPVRFTTCPSFWIHLQASRNKRLFRSRPPRILVGSEKKDIGNDTSDESKQIVRDTTTARLLGVFCFGIG